MEEHNKRDQHTVNDGGQGANVELGCDEQRGDADELQRALLVAGREAEEAVDVVDGDVRGDARQEELLGDLLCGETRQEERKHTHIRCWLRSATSTSTSSRPSPSVRLQVFCVHAQRNL